MVAGHEETFENPYAHRAVASDEKGPIADPFVPQLPPLSPRVIARSVGVWSLVCAVGATPSYIIARGVVSHPWSSSIMIAGVACFASLCIAVHLCWGRSFFAERPRLRRAVHASYALRILQTAAVPIGWFVDSTCGMLSLGLVNHLGGDVAYVAPLIFLTVLLQGILLNVVLWCLVPLNYAVISFFSRSTR